MNSNLGRTLASACVVLLCGAVNFILNPIATLLSGETAGRQFQASDAVSVQTSWQMGLLGHLAIPGAVVVAALAVIWRRPLKALWRGLFPCAAVLLLCAAPWSKAEAYYDTADRTEAYTILPNESAFWIPDVGDNKASQSQFDSEQYLQANKVAAKRFVIPHVKLAGTGGFVGWDAYVPSGRLIIVDRTPYSKEWVAARDRGTSTRNESFPCQSKEGLNISTGVSIAASVSEPNAAKFLYRFGVRPMAGNRNDPNIIFFSIYYGRSLGEVMDDVGRKKVQTLVCNEIAARSFDQDNAEANAIMDSVRKNLTDYLSSLGITLEFIGWADTFTFDPEVQKAVNDRFIAATVAPSLPTLQALADVRVKEGLGDGLRNHGLPSSLVAIPEKLLGTLGSMFGAKTPETPSTAK